MKKIALGAIFSIGLISSAFGATDDRLDTLEKEMQEISARNPQDTLGANFVTSRPEVDGTNWFVTFNLIYWHTKMGGTEYAYALHPHFSGATLLPRINGDIKENDLGWDLGLKVGLGYKTPHDSWDVYARYTYFNADHSSTSTKQEPSALVPLPNFGNFGPQFATKVKSRVEIDYDNIDLELARSYFVSSRLAFRTHIDLKATWMDIDQDVAIIASSIQNTNSTTGLAFKVKDDCNFWGLGPRAGVDSKWFLGYGFHIFGDLAGALQYGYFKTQEKQLVPPSLQLVPNLRNGQVLKMKEKFHRFVPSAQMFLGLGYDTYINNHKQHVGLKLGYEVQYYWRVNQITNPDDFTTGQNATQARLQFEKFSEDVMFYGINGEARLDF